MKKKIAIIGGGIAGLTLACCLSKEAYTIYEQHQFPRSKKIIQEILRLGQIGQLTNPLLFSLRNFFFKITPASLAMKMIDQYFSYRVTEIRV